MGLLFAILLMGLPLLASIADMMGVDATTLGASVLGVPHKPAPKPAPARQYAANPAPAPIGNPVTTEPVAPTPAHKDFDV